ncbi:MAG: porin family protein [Muribaculaceae bacterium]
MKKIFLAILFVASFIAFDASAQFRYGPTLGVDFTTLKFKQDLFTVDQSVGYQAGIQGEMMFPGIGFGVDIGAMYEQRGATLNLGEKKVWSSQGYGSHRSYLHYLSIPINLRFKWTRMNGLEDYIAPYVFGGPNISFMLAHSSIDALDYTTADLGLQVGFGFEVLKRWQIQASYDWGMTYCVKTKILDDHSAKNRTWSVRVVRFF